MIAAWGLPLPGLVSRLRAGTSLWLRRRLSDCVPLILLVDSAKSVRMSPRHGSQVLCAHDLIEYDCGGDDRIVCRVIAEHCLCLGIDEDGQV